MVLAITAPYTTRTRGRKRERSGATRASLQCLRFLDRLFDGADHVESLFRQMVVFPVDDRLEAADRILERNVLAWRAREGFGDMEGLRQEALDLARPRDGKLVLGRKLVHAQYRDDVAQFLVTLQRLLNATCHGVVFFAET